MLSDDSGSVGAAFQVDDGNADRESTEHLPHDAGFRLVPCRRLQVYHDSILRRHDALVRSIVERQCELLRWHQQQEQRLQRRRRCDAHLAASRSFGGSTIWEAQRVYFDGDSTALKLVDMAELGVRVALYESGAVGRKRLQNPGPIQHCWWLSQLAKTSRELFPNSNSNSAVLRTAHFTKKPNRYCSDDGSCPDSRTSDCCSEEGLLSASSFTQCHQQRSEEKDNCDERIVLQHSQALSPKKPQPSRIDKKVQFAASRTITAYEVKQWIETSLLVRPADRLALLARRRFASLFGLGVHYTDPVRLAWGWFVFQRDYV